jgi:hypothetical protein
LSHEENELLRELQRGTWRAYSVISSYMQARIRELPGEKRDEINEKILDDLSGIESPNPLPFKEDRYKAALMYCVIDAMTQIKHLEFHLQMVRRNPFSQSVPDSDYLNILNNSFYETCYVVHERMRKLLDLLQRRKLVTLKIQRVADAVLLTPSRRSRDRKTVFDVVLRSRAVHVHEGSVDRPSVPRLNLLALFANIARIGDAGDAELRMLLQAELRRHTRKARKENLEELGRVLQFVKAGADAFFEAVSPVLKKLLLPLGAEA